MVGSRHGGGQGVVGSQGNGSLGVVGSWCGEGAGWWGSRGWWL